MENHKKTIHLGIIGAGKVTTQPNRHIDSIRSLHDKDVEITAIADITPGLAADVAEEFHIPYSFEDYHDLLAMEPLTLLPSIHRPLPINRLRWIVSAQVNMFM